MQKYILVIFILFYYCLNAQDSSENCIMPIFKNDKYGYVDINGEEVISMKFDDIKTFSEGLVAVNRGARTAIGNPSGGKWGYYNAFGKEVIPIMYDDAKNFNEGLALVKLNGQYGFIDTANHTIIPFKYEDAFSFSEGLAAVKIDGKWGFINKVGDLVIEPDFVSVGDFFKGFSLVCTKQEYYPNYLSDKSGKCGLIDKSGRLALDTIYDFIGEFINGFARIGLNGKEGFINENAEIVIPFIYDKVKNFSEGYAAVGKYFDINSYFDSTDSQTEIDSLKKVILDEFKKSDEYVYYQMRLMNSSFYKNAPKVDSHIVYGYINEKGVQKIDFLYEDAEQFKANAAKVNFGFCHKVDIIVNKERTTVSPNGIVTNFIGKTLIDTSSAIVCDTSHRVSSNSNDSIIIVYNSDGAGAMLNQKTIIENQYKSLYYLGDSYFLAEMKGSEDRLYIINKENQLLFEVKKRYIKVPLLLVQYAGNGKFFIQKEKRIPRNKQRYTRYNRIKYGLKSGMINDKGKWILKPKYDYIGDFEYIQN